MRWREGHVGGLFGMRPQGCELVSSTTQQAAPEGVCSHLLTCGWEDFKAMTHSRLWGGVGLWLGRRLFCTFLISFI